MFLFGIVITLDEDEFNDEEVEDECTLRKDSLFTWFPWFYPQNKLMFILNVLLKGQNTRRRVQQSPLWTVSLLAKFIGWGFGRVNLNVNLFLFLTYSYS